MQMMGLAMLDLDCPGGPFRVTGRQATREQSKMSTMSWAGKLWYQGKLRVTRQTSGCW